MLQQIHAPQLLSLSERAEGSYLVQSAIGMHLQQLGFPETGLNSMLKCGLVTGQVLIHCGCGFKLIQSKHHCNYRECPNCAHIRKARILRKYMPMLKSFASDRHNDFYSFITIAPENFENLSEGLNFILKKFSAFRRLKYVRERLKGGISIIEVTNNGVGWHVHLHIIAYGRSLDGHIRGYCKDCHQNIMHFDKTTQTFYCANEKCKSPNVTVKEPSSKISRLWEKSCKRKSRFDIRTLYGPRDCLAYLLKYVSVSNGQFVDDFQMAQYIFSTRNRPLINKFGIFLGFQTIKVRCFCEKCNQYKEIITDAEVISVYLTNIRKPKPSDLSTF